MNIYIPDTIIDISLYDMGVIKVKSVQTKIVLPLTLLGLLFGQAAQDTTEISNNITKLMEYFDEIARMSVELSKGTENLHELVGKYTV